MKPPNITAAARCAKDVAHKVGVFLKSQLRTPKHINLQTAHDIKLELDNRSQAMIERGLRKGFPHVPFLGEEGEVGDTTGEWRWVVDPIDGTVNFSRGIPHACVSIALQQRRADATGHWADYDSVIGVVYDPFLDEMWTARAGGKAKLNGRAIHVSETSTLETSIVSIGFSKSRTTIKKKSAALCAVVPTRAQSAVDGQRGSGAHVDGGGSAGCVPAARCVFVGRCRGWAHS